MHDQKKSDRRPMTEEQREQFLQSEKRKGALYLSQKEGYTHKVFTEEKLTENAELLVAVPEAYSFYTYRRKILQALWADARHPAGEARNPLTDLVAELKLNSKILEKDFKIYAAFVHRHWCYEELARRAATEVAADDPARLPSNVGGAMAPPATADALASVFPVVSTLLEALVKEAKQCEALLKLDERNFHAWNHRRWAQQKLREAEALQHQARLRWARAVSVAEVVDEHRDSTTAADAAMRDDPAPYASLFDRHGTAEMAYTTARIKGNFSNYSAWHQRALTIRSALFQVGDSHTEANSSSGATARLVFKPIGAAEGEGTWCAALLSLLQEDLHFLTQAIYCDPSDQSAWFYASFMLSVFEAFKAAHPAFFVVELEHADADSASHHSDGRYAGKEVERAFLVAAFDLIAEEKRLGDVECYLPHYFLFAHLARLLRRARQRGPLSDPPARLAERDPAAPVVGAGDEDCVRTYVEMAKARELLPASQEEEQGKTPLFRLGEALYTHLIAVDGLRCGLYEDLFRSFQPE